MMRPNFAITCSSVEDPRINIQSILSRHFLLTAVYGDNFARLMQEELRFGAAMNCLCHMVEQLGDQSDLEAVLYALRHDADNADGIVIPGFVLQTFRSLESTGGAPATPNYVETFLDRTDFIDGKPVISAKALDTFQQLWQHLLSSSPTVQGEHLPPRVLEAACGSANDYRFLVSCGIAPLLEYRGFDLCARNIENARALFPESHFIEGNVFAIDAADRSFDLCFAHDLFEHLSLEGLEAAINEVCRVTRKALCFGFFQMDERPEHVVRPVDDYHWNLLSLAKTRASFAQHGFLGQCIHIASLLRQQFECDYTHNPNAYTLIFSRQRDR